MSGPLEELFEELRSQCSSGSWSRGVELARAEAVSGERETDDEIVVRVAVPNAVVSPTVVLYPDDADWDCDCASREPACEHAAAAVIAVRRARNAGQSLPAGRQAEAGRLAVRLTRENGALSFERVVVAETGESPLRSTIAAVRSGRVDGPDFLATGEDVALESALGTQRRGVLPRGVWSAVLAALARIADVQLDGTPITASSEQVGFQGRLEDGPAGFRLRVRPDPRILERFEGDLVLLDDQTLCRAGASNLSGRELEELRRGRDYAADEAAALVTEVLPSLRERIPVEIATNRLPKTHREPPRLSFEIARDGDTLRVLPLLVYGDPPTARVDAGQLVALGGPVPLRDEAAERALLRQLQSELELAPGRRLESTGGDALALADRLRRWPDLADDSTLRGFARRGSLEPRPTLDGDRFDLSFAGGDGEGTASAGAVLSAWREGESWVPLDGGGFAEIPSDWLRAHGARVADLLAARGERDALPPTAWPELIAFAADHDLTPAPDVLALCERLEGEDDASPALPDGLRATLRHYQEDGVAWLGRLRDAGLPALLADDMGLGKTLQTLCAVRGRTLVVAPTSVLPNWAAEAERFRPDLSVCRYHGASRSLDPDADLTVTSYALLRLDAKKLGEIDWDCVVLDESQAIKNPDSQVARAAHALPGRFRIALSGTPVENRLAELWSQFQFLARGWLGDRKRFDEIYAKPIAAGDAEAAERLRRRIRPFVLRRLKRDVAPELPPRTEIVLHVELSEPERTLYDTIRAATRDDVAKRFAAGANPLQALEALLRLRQAACHGGLVPGSEVTTSAKLEVLRERLESSVAEGHKALVFSQWTSLLDRVEPVLRDAELPFARLDGSTADRGAVVDAFQAEDGPPVLLVSLRAGGSGLNLTAADTVYILDPWWNPAVEAQAADRAHRIGQTRPVVVARLVATDTVEERVLALQERKRALGEAALGEGTVAPLNREEILDLLRS
ncbi:MAG: DEAD/DEAH box helicase [Myxococcota bacterium]